MIKQHDHLCVPRSYSGQLPVQYSSMVQWQASCAAFLDGTVASFLRSIPRSYSGNLPVQYSSMVQWQPSCSVFLDRTGGKVASSSCSAWKRCRGRICDIIKHQDRSGAGFVTLIRNQNRSWTGFATLIRYQDHSGTGFVTRIVPGRICDVEQAPGTLQGPGTWQRQGRSDL